MADYKGPGQWRSQAEHAGTPDTVFGQLREHHRFATDRGDHQAAAHIAAASDLLLDGETDEAADTLHRAAEAMGTAGASHADGLRAIAGELE